MVPRQECRALYAEQSNAAEVCAMADQKQPLHKKLWTLSWESIYKQLLILALSALLTWVSQGKMPTAIAHPAEYWLLTGTIFFGSLGGIAFFVRMLTAFSRWAKGKIHHKRRVARLHALDSEEKTIFNSYISRDTRSLHFEFTNGTVANLILFGFLFRPNPYMDLRNPNPTVMMDWVWDYLHEHPELLEEKPE